MIATFERQILNQTNYAVAFKDVILQEAAKILGVSTASSKAINLANSFEAQEQWSEVPGAEGLLVEAHPDPSIAWSDADQALGLDDLRELVGYTARVSATIGQ